LKKELIEKEATNPDCFWRWVVVAHSDWNGGVHQGILCSFSFC